MSKKNTRNKKTMITKNNRIIIEKDVHRTNKQRILHLLCLLLPIIAAFAAYFLTPNKFSELAKFFICISAFLAFASIIFILTRKENPVIKIILKDALVLNY